MDKARETALKALIEIEAEQAYSNLLLKKRLGTGELNTRDRAFVTELVYGTLTRKLTLDWVIAQYSKTKLAKLSKWVLQILRMGIYQILFLDKVPVSAACNTSVDLAKKYAKASSGFINAILRNISRQKEEIRFEGSGGSLERNLSIQYSFPEFLVVSWLSQFGEDFTRELLASLLERPDLTVRINTLKVSKEELIKELADEGIEVSTGRLSEDALIVQSSLDISTSRAYLEGRMTVQDESSMLVTQILDPKPGERILDACSAPGGKATHIGQYMNNKGCIAAWDVHEHKIPLIRQNAIRLGIENITAERKDAVLPVEEGLIGRFHRVLVDAPCSGTGIIRRKPDIKWQRKKDDFGSLVEIQRKILYNASRMVMPGGVLVYSTCSLDDRENAGIVHDFLAHNPDYRVESIKDRLPACLHQKKELDEGMLRLFPHLDYTDGFFIARMRKNEG